jgi:hypothetical protein
MTNYISFSLYGEKKIYIVGAIENVKLCSKIYPGWTPIVYVDEMVPSYAINELRNNGALVINGTDNISKNKMVWRLSAVLINDAEKVVFRDADSRVSPRESACVNAWLDSGKALHIMRDHPYHANWIMGGMWGIDATVGSKYVEHILSIAQGDEVGEDQHLLARELYRHLRTQTFVHDSFFNRENWSEEFPTPRLGEEFVGERIDEEGVPETAMREMLVRYEGSKFLRHKIRRLDARRIRTDQKLHFDGTRLKWLTRIWSRFFEPGT